MNAFSGAVKVSGLGPTVSVTHSDADLDQLQINGGTAHDTFNAGDGIGALLNLVFVGEAGDDGLIGGNGSEVFVGGDGSDFLQGNAGNDVLVGGSQNDFMDGGAGADFFDCGDRLFEFCLGPSGEADDEVGREREIRDTGAQLVYETEVALAAVRPAHGLQDAGRAGLQRQMRVLADCSALGHRLDHRPAQLSGGEQQRTAIARALANAPKLLLADEPTGNLDPSTSAHVFHELLELIRHSGVSALIATHNLALAKRMHRVLVLDSGRLHEVAPASIPG